MPAHPIDPGLLAVLGEPAGSALKRWLVQTGRSARMGERLTGGRTQAVLVSVIIEEFGLPARKVILKRCPPKGDDLREPGKHRTALQRSPREFTSQHLVQQIYDPIRVDDGGWLLVQDIAGGGITRLQQLETLRRDDPDALAASCAIVVRSVLLDWNPGTNAPREPVPDFFRRHLGRRLDPGGPPSGWARAVLEVVPESPLWLTLPGEAWALPNPLALVRETPLSEGLEIDALVGHAHGDLNLRNILIPYPPPNATEYRLIDLSRYEPDAPLTRDSHYLLLSIASDEFDELSASQQVALLDALVEPDPADGEARLPAWLRDTVVAVRKMGVEWAESSSLYDEWVAASRLSLVATALLFVGRTSLPVSRRQWFLRLAARAAAAFVRTVGRDIPATASTWVPSTLPPRGSSPVAGTVPAAAARPPRDGSHALLEFAERLAHVGCMRDRDGREQVVQLLPSEISPRIPRHLKLYQDALSIVRTCDEYPGGLDRLLEIVHKLEGDSESMHRLMAWIRTHMPWLGPVAL